MTKISIVDYGVGNLHSIRRGIELAGADARVTSDRTEIEDADAIVYLEWELSMTRWRD